MCNGADDGDYEGSGKTPVNSIISLLSFPKMLLQRFIFAYLFFLFFKDLFNFIYFFCSTPTQATQAHQESCLEMAAVRM